MKREVDDRLEARLGLVLLAGGRVSTGLLALGLLSVPVVGTARAAPLLRIGLMVLVCVPVTRVLVAAAGFASAREWGFTLLTLVVLTMVLSSLAGF